MAAFKWPLPRRSRLRRFLHRASIGTNCLFSRVCVHTLLAGVTLTTWSPRLRYHGDKGRQLLYVAAALTSNRQLGSAVPG